MLLQLILELSPNSVFTSLTCFGPAALSPDSTFYFWFSSGKSCQISKSLFPMRPQATVVLFAGIAAAVPDTIPFSASPHQLSPSTVALRILIGFVNDPHCIPYGACDPRYNVLVPLAAELTRRGHTVLWRSEPDQEEILLGHGFLGGIVGSTYEHYDPSTANASGIDVAILWGAEETEVPLPSTTKRLVYENGFTSGAITVDPSGLLGGSFYARSLNTECRNTGMDETMCKSLIANHLSSDSSKRPQSSETDIDASLFGRYLLVPTQKMRGEREPREQELRVRERGEREPQKQHSTPNNNTVCILPQLDLPAADWRDYFERVYGTDDAGSLPTSAEQVDVLNLTALTSVSSAAKNYVAQLEATFPRWYAWDSPAWDSCFDDACGPDHFVGNLNVHCPVEFAWRMRLHADQRDQGARLSPLPNNSLAEVTHCGGSDFESDAAYFYASRGSGVWINVGRTISFGTHDDAVRHFIKRNCAHACEPRTDVMGLAHNCAHQCDAWHMDKMVAVAASEGYDTVQFVGHCDAKCAMCLHEVVVLRAQGGPACPPIAYWSGSRAQLNCTCVEHSSSVGTKDKPDRGGCASCDARQLAAGIEGGAHEGVRGERFIEGRGPVLPVTLPELLKETIQFGKAKGIPVVVEMQMHEEAEQMQMVRALADECGYTNGVHFSNSSINVLRKEALFTVTINGDTIIENFYTGTPVLACGTSMWTQTDGVLHDSNLARGLHTMSQLLADVGWSEERVDRQREAVCWYESHSMNEGKTVDENIAVLQAHLDAFERDWTMTRMGDTTESWRRDASVTRGVGRLIL